MDDLIAFLNGRLDEQQAHADKDLWALDRASNGGDWKGRYGYNLPTSVIEAGAKQVAITVASVDGLVDGEENQHAKDAFVIARLVKVARRRANEALADVAAKRAIIHKHAPLDLRAANYGPPRMHDIVCQMCAGGEPYPCPTLRLLGSAYADHPDYRAEWKP